MTMPEARYGTWSSPVSSDLVASTGTAWNRFERPEPAPDGLYWLESRPHEGRTALVFKPWDGEPQDAVPAGFNVRNSVHEYGGGANWRHGAALFCTNFDDQRVYRLDGIGAEPRAITPEPDEPLALRYADGVVTPEGETIVCVRERHQGEVVNELVVLPSDGSAGPRTIAPPHDFFSSPAVHPDGSQLAWLSWDHPQLPFIGTDLWVGPVGGEPRHVAGGPAESVFQPQWSPDGTLYFVSDTSGWWNLYREHDGTVEPVAPVEAELGWMQWQFGLSSYVFMPDGRIACILNRGSRQPLTFLDPESGAYKEAGVDYDSVRYPFLRAHGQKLAWIGASPTQAPAVLLYDAEDGEFEVVRSSVDDPVDETLVARAEAIEFPTGEGTGYAFYYPPTNPDFTGPADERPPLVVSVHGGPTAQSVAGPEPAFLYLTSRGIAVVDVNYGGSTGYGRPYRERLKERWGPVDTADCIAAARFLAARGDVDPERIAITGGSAGGYTTLYALTFEDFFATGASFFGVSDLLAFNETTHKFESQYDRWLIGPYPEEAERLEARSPASAADDIRVPVLLLQGLDDKVVPPSQAEIMVEALRRNGVPFAYIAFEGEGHGFRRAENLRRSYEAMLDFFSRVWRFDPADDLEPVEIENLGD
jgi:dipeptidyl aminopeptidase/acylaminoacyl peptidase